MKKFLLSFSALALSFGLFAQSSVEDYKVLKQGMTKLSDNKQLYTGFEEVKGNVDINTKSQAQVGTSTYDLQTNSSVNTNLLQGANGDLHATWIRSETFDLGAADRGTGYNVYSNGSWGPAPTVRIEPERVGWPCLFELGNGTIGVATHTGSSGTNIALKNSLTGNWDSSIIPGDADAVWNRAAATGNTIHLIVGRLGTAFDGIDGGLVYRRSEDGGDTWTEAVLFPGFTNHYTSGGGDQYAIAADGDDVAVVYGAYASRVLLFKSADGGNTWTETIIQDVVDPLLATADNVNFLPTFCADGVNVTLDTEGNAHVAYNARFNFFDDADAPDIYYQPALSQNLMYWNEGMEDPMHVGAAFRLDNDGNGDNLFDSATADGNGYLGGLLTHPSIGRDADNNIVIAYDAAIIDAFDDNGNPYRDVYMVKSTDGGASWEGPFNVSNNPSAENAFPAIPKVFDGDVPVLFQTDAYHGTAVQADATEINHPYVENGIEVEFVALDDINGDDVDLSLNAPMIYTRWRGLGLDQGCDFDFEFWGIYAFDYPDGQLDITFESLPGFDYDPNVPGEYDVYLSATDSDGNTTAVDTLTINVIEDVDAPIWLSESTCLQVEEGATVDLPTPEFIDNSLCGGDAEIMVDGSVDTSTPGSYAVTYTVTDFAGNTSEPLVVEVEVLGPEGDVSAPQLDVDSEETVLIEANVNNEFFCPDYTAFDCLDGDVTGNVVVTGCDDVDVNTPGEYVVTFEVSDAAGNPAEYTVTVTVQDTSTPTLTVLAGQNTQVVECNGELPDPAGLFGVIDNGTPQTVANFTLNEDGSVDTATNGEYVVSYTVTDAAGNTSSAQSVTYIVSGCIESAIQTVLGGVVSVLPNPTNGELFVDLSQTPVQNAVISVYDLQGRIITSVQADNVSSAIRLDLSNFADGVYMIQIDAGEFGVATDRVILSK